MSLDRGIWIKEEPKNKIVVDKSSCNDTMIDKILVIAGNFNGMVFGEYVRNVIVPKTKICFKSVDVWFWSENNYLEFLRDVNFYLKLFCNLYSFKVSSNTNEYHLYRDDKFITIFKLFVSESMPANDFDINLLIYQFHLDKEPSGRFIRRNGFYGDPESYKRKMIDNINNKKLNMLDSYAEKVLKYNTNDRDLFIKEINESFLSQGWTISCFKDHIFPSSIDEDWLLNVFNPTARLYFSLSK